jgi:hypothetical protein
MARAWTPAGRTQRRRAARSCIPCKWSARICCPPAASPDPGRWVGPSRTHAHARARTHVQTHAAHTHAHAHSLSLSRARAQTNTGRDRGAHQDVAAAASQRARRGRGPPGDGVHRGDCDGPRTVGVVVARTMHTCTQFGTHNACTHVHTYTANTTTTTTTRSLHSVMIAL